MLNEEVAGEVQKSYQYSPWGKRLSQVTHNGDGTTEDGYYGYNAHTDVETVTDESGNPAATYGYTAYGNNDEAEFTGADAPDAGTPGDEPYNVYRYNAKRFDPTSGLYDMGFRDYSPGLNRFLSRDMYTGALADLNLQTSPWTSNRYAFTGGNPTTFIEYDGHFIIDPDVLSDITSSAMNWWDDTSDDPVGNRHDLSIGFTSGVVQAGEETVDFATGGVGQPGLIEAVAGDTNVASDWMGENLGANSESIMFQAGDVGGQVGSAAIPVGGAASTAPRAARWLTNLLGRTRTGSDDLARVSDETAQLSDNAANTSARACSFTGTTVVLMADGSRKPIKDVKVGDLVIATDPETGEQEAKRVEHVFVHDDTMVDLRIDGETVATTEDHPFWSVTDERFKRADELAVGEQVLAADGRSRDVVRLALKSSRQALAYNLSVEGIHTYHVGDAEILVHNNCFTALDVLSDPQAVKGLTPNQIDDLVRNAGLEVAAGKAGAKNPATRYYLPGTNRSQGFRVLPQGVAGESGVKGGAYLKYFGGPLHGKRVELGAP